MNDYLYVINSQSKQISGKEQVEPEKQTVASEKKAKKISPTTKKVPSTKKEENKNVKEAKRKGGIIYYLNVHDI